MGSAARRQKPKCFGLAWLQLWRRRFSVWTEGSVGKSLANCGGVGLVPPRRLPRTTLSYPTRGGWEASLSGALRALPRRQRPGIEEGSTGSARRFCAPGATQRDSCDRRGGAAECAERPGDDAGICGPVQRRTDGGSAGVPAHRIALIRAEPAILRTVRKKKDPGGGTYFVRILLSIDSMRGKLCVFSRAGSNICVGVCRESAGLSGSSASLCGKPG